MHQNHHHNKNQTPQKDPKHLDPDSIKAKLQSAKEELKKRYEDPVEKIKKGMPDERGNDDDDKNERMWEPMRSNF
jgi:hypothetical protein